MRSTAASWQTLWGCLQLPTFRLLKTQLQPGRQPVCWQFFPNLATDQGLVSGAPAASDLLLLVLCGKRSHRNVAHSPPHWPSEWQKYLQHTISDRAGYVSHIDPGSGGVWTERGSCICIPACMQCSPSYPGRKQAQGISSYPRMPRRSK